MGFAPCYENKTRSKVQLTILVWEVLVNDYEEYAGYAINYWPFTGERLTFYALMCKVCVAIFVFISGYGIAASYENQFGEKEPKKGETGRFIFIRWWKLLTAYWFIFILTFLCQPLGRTVFNAYGRQAKEIVLCFFLDVMGLSYLLGTPTLNPNWWYISLALAIIVYVPVFLRITKKTGILVSMAVDFLAL